MEQCARKVCDCQQNQSQDQFKGVSAPPPDREAYGLGERDTLLNLA
jgi:hypothetical protein